jgi:hypothetical protein
MRLDEEMVSVKHTLVATLHHLDIGALIHALTPWHRLVLLANGVSKCWEAVSWVEDCEDKDTDDDHDTLEDDELSLIAHEFTPPSSSQLGDTVDASDEYSKISGDDGEHEAAERGLVEQSHGLAGNLVATAVGADGVLDEKDTKASKNDDLEDDSSNHEVGADILHVGSVVGGRSNTTTSSLKDKREDITRDEDISVPGRSKARPGFAEGNDDVLEGQVDTGGNEGRRDDQAADLDLEAELVEGVVPEHYTTDVSDELAETAQCESNHVCPCLVSDSKNKLDETAKPKEGSEECVGSNVWCIPVESTLNWAQRANLFTEFGCWGWDSHCDGRW